MCDDRHEISYRQIDNMGQAWEALCVTTEGVNLFAIKDVLDCAACCVIVASIVGSDAENLRGLNDLQNRENVEHTLVEQLIIIPARSQRLTK